MNFNEISHTFKIINDIKQQFHPISVNIIILCFRFFSFQNFLAVFWTLLNFGNFVLIITKAMAKNKKVNITITYIPPSVDRFQSIYLWWNPQPAAIHMYPYHSRQGRKHQVWEEGGGPPMSSPCRRWTASPRQPGRRGWNTQSFLTLHQWLHTLNKLVPAAQWLNTRLIIPRSRVWV